MTTQRIAALEGRITEVMRHVAEQENVPVEEVRDLLASGKVAGNIRYGQHWNVKGITKTDKAG